MLLRSRTSVGNRLLAPTRPRPSDWRDGLPECRTRIAFSSSEQHLSYSDVLSLSASCSVHVPADLDLSSNASLPVIVWIHGGG